NFPGVAGYVRALAGMACGPARGGFVDDRSRDEHPVDGHTDVSAVRARVRADPGGGPDGVEARPRWVAGLPELSGAVPGSGRRGGPARGGERWGGGGDGRGVRERGVCLAARGAHGGHGRTWLHVDRGARGGRGGLDRGGDRGAGSDRARRLGRGGGGGGGGGPRGEWSRGEMGDGGGEATGGASGSGA